MLPMNRARRIAPASAMPARSMIVYLLCSGAGAGLLVQLALRVLTSPTAVRLDPSALPPLGLYATACVPAALAGFWLVNTIAAGVTQRSTSDGYREWWARAGGASLALGLAWVALFGLVIYGPAALLDALARALPVYSR